MPKIVCILYPPDLEEKDSHQFYQHRHTAPIAVSRTAIAEPLMIRLHSAP